MERALLHPDDRPPDSATRKQAREFIRGRVLAKIVEGYTVAEIGQQLDLTPDQIRRHTERAMQTLAEGTPEVDDYRLIHIRRINDLLKAWWGRAHEDAEAFDRVVKLMEREARLLGLDAPVKRDQHLAISGSVQVRPDLSAVTTEDLRELKALLTSSKEVIDAEAVEVKA